MARSVVPHLSLTFGGFLGGAAGLEIWQCGLKLTPFSTGANVETDKTLAGTRVSAIAGSANMQTLLTTPVVNACKVLNQALADPSVSLTWVKLNAIGADTLQVNPVTLMSSFAAVPGTQTSSTLPWSSGLVCEHRTNNRSRGFASHGRMTYPAAILVDRPSGRVTGVGSNALTVATTAYAAFLAKLNLQDGTNTGYAFYPSIVYSTDSTKTYKVGGVSRSAVSTKLETFFLSTIPGQVRSRQNKLPIGGTSQTVTYGTVNV